MLITAGGKNHIKAEKGNITGKGVTVISEGENTLKAGQSIDLITAVNERHHNEEKTDRGVGGARISDTERFFGYQRELSDIHQSESVHIGSRLVSLNGKINIDAGEAYRQTSGQLLAKEGIEVNASSIKTDTAFNTRSLQSHESDLKVGNFTRIKSPIIDLINTVERAVKNKEASNRVKAANIMSIAAQGYNVSELTFDPSQWHMDKNPMDAGYLFRVESGVGFSHKRDNRKGWEKISVENQFNAPTIRLNAHSGGMALKHTHLTSRDESGKRLKDSAITLSARDGLDYQGGEDLRYYKGKQQSSGVEVGMAFSVGAKMGWSFYVQAGFNQGRQHQEGQLIRNSVVDTERFVIKTGDTQNQHPKQHQSHANLTAVTAKAKDIETKVDGNLTLTSLQSHEINRTSNAGGGFQVEGGFSTSWNASANAHASSGKGERHQVLEQAGLYAENAYHIEADNVHLEGAVIASNNAKASELNTNKLTFNDIENRSSSYAASAGVSVGTKEKEGESNPQYNPGLPQYEAQNDRTLTKATLTEGNITLNKDTNPTQTTAKALGINTDIAQSNAQTETPKDINKQLEEQQQIAAAAGHVKSAVETFVKNQRKEAEIKLAQEQAAYEAEKAKARAEGKETPKKSTALETAEQNVKDWGTGGSTKRAIDALTNAGLIALSGGSAQSIATAAASPYVNQLIKDATKDYPALNIPTHILWGAVEAELMGGNAQTGAISTAAGELGAKYLTEHLYQKDAKDLTETERNQIKEMAKALAGVAGGLSAAGQGSSAVKILSESSIGATVANNAVENNSLADDIHPSIERKQNIEMYAKVYFNGDEDKAAEFIEGLEIAEARGQIDSVKDLVQLVLNPLDSVKSLWDVVSNPSETYEQILITESQWSDAYKNALENDPKLAGEMSGYLRGNLKGVPTGGVLLTGSGLAMAKGIIKVSDFIKSGKLNLVRKSIPNSGIGIVWGKGISGQGKPWEAYVQSKLPEGSINLNDIKTNFKTFDHLLPDGTAISSKTMDTIGSKTYQNPSKITYTLNKYVDEMVNFKSDGKGRFMIHNSDINSRELYLAIPAKTTRAQMKAIDKSIDYARSKGANIIVNKVN